MKITFKYFCYFFFLIIFITYIIFNLLIINSQNNKISLLQQKITLKNTIDNERQKVLKTEYDFINEKIDRINNYYKYTTNYEDDSFNLLALGNSLTLIDSWERGICSTYPDNDYYGLLKSELINHYQKVISYRYNFAIYEQLSNNKRNEALQLIDSFLSEKLNLIIVQLGENVQSIEYYEENLSILIEYIKEKSPNAIILMIGDWWSYERNEIRKNVCAKNNLLFADLSEIINNPDYQSQTGSICYLNDGTTIIVPEIAATHPGDKGFEYIYNKIVECLKEKNIL